MLAHRVQVSWEVTVSNIGVKVNMYCKWGILSGGNNYFKHCIKTRYLSYYHTSVLLVTICYAVNKQFVVVPNVVFISVSFYQCVMHFIHRVTSVFIIKARDWFFCFCFNLVERMNHCTVQWLFPSICNIEGVSKVYW